MAMRRAAGSLLRLDDLAEGRGYTLKRRLLGKPLINEQLGDQRLSKTLALGVLSPDGISSSAYGTEEILIELLKGGLAITAFSLILPLTGVVLFVMILVVLSYREVVSIYTRAGGSYVVARDNFGPRVAQIAAVALLIDYVVTVAVQVAAGTAAVASAFPNSPINNSLAITLISIGVVMLSTLVPVGATTALAPVVSSSPSTTLPGSTTTTTTTTFVPVPSAMQPEMPAVTPTHRVKVVLLGDSIAGSLGVGLSEYESNDNLEIVNEGIPGCSLSMAQEIRVLFYTLPPGSPCNPNDPNALLAQWKTWIDQYNPDVVLYLARGETFDQEHNGAWGSIEDASFDRYLQSRYRAAVDVLGSRGATVVLMTTPYYSSGVQVTGAIWPEDTPSRAVIDNEIMGRVADSMTTGPSHTRVYVFNLNAVVSPGNHFVTNLGPVDLRCSDGVHFSRPGGVFVGLQLLPDLALLGQAHAAASPGGAWHGPLPASTPTWYQKLPCQ